MSFICGESCCTRLVGDQGSNRDTDEGVQRIPDHVEDGNLIGNKFEREHGATDADDPPVAQNLETRWQNHPVRWASSPNVSTVA